MSARTIVADAVKSAPEISLWITGLARWVSDLSSLRITSYFFGDFELLLW